MSYTPVNRKSDVTMSLLSLTASPSYQYSDAFDYATPEGWAPDSWTTKPIKQDVKYEDETKLRSILAKLSRLPPIVHHTEIERLKSQLAECSRGERFLLQGGDCAEIFDYCSQVPIENKLKILLQMSLILTWGGRIPVVRIARMAGQYAKPRSKPTEIVDGKEILAFRGDNVNGFSPDERTPDPERLLGAYFHSATTVNYVRSLIAGGFADLHHPQDWNLDHIRNPTVRAEYESIVRRLVDALDFMKTIGNDGSTNSTTGQVDMFMSHEGLLLEYEQALTRLVTPRGPVPNKTAINTPGGTETDVDVSRYKPKQNEGSRHYNLGTHFLWIGDRTRQLDGAHVEYFRGLANPIGVKVGPSMTPAELPELVRKLNPYNEAGKITLITRYGASQVEKYLPAHIKAIMEANLSVVWCSDPMHGNIEVTKTGLKTRRFENILTEISLSRSIHKTMGSVLGGVHFELTGDSNITECIGGSMELQDVDLSLNYQTFCDPRLNCEQSLDMAFLIAKYYEQERQSKAVLDKLERERKADEERPRSDS